MAAPIVTTGVALTVATRAEARAVRARAEARDDLAVHAVRIVDVDGPHAPSEPLAATRARVRRHWQRAGAPPRALDELDAATARATPPEELVLRHAARLCSADTGFLLVVVDPAGAVALAPILGLLSAGFDRPLVAAASADEALAVPLARPDPARLARGLDGDLLTAALGDGPPAVSAWHAWRARESIDDFPYFGQVAPLLAEQLERLEVDDPDLERIQGVRRRAWYAHQMHLRDAAQAVVALRRASCDTLVTGDFAVAVHLASAGAVRAVPRVELSVAPDDAPRAVEVLVGQGWTPDGALTDGRFHRQTSLLLRQHPGRTLVLRWHPFPQRGSRLVPPAPLGSRRAVDLHGTTAETPAPTELLLRHWARTGDPLPGHLFHTLCTTADLVRTGEIDWARLWSGCERLALTDYGTTYLRLLETHTGQRHPVPEGTRRCG